MVADVKLAFAIFSYRYVVVPRKAILFVSCTMDEDGGINRRLCCRKSQASPNPQEFGF